MSTTYHCEHTTGSPGNDLSSHRSLPSPLKPADCYLLVQGQQIPLSEAEVQVILDTLKILKQGKSVADTTDETYMTTQQAADILNVSRPYLVKLLENKDIPFIKVGNRRRVLTKDVLNYKTHRDAERRQALQKFSRELAEDGLYDLDYNEVNQIINED